MNDSRAGFVVKQKWVLLNSMKQRLEINWIKGDKNGGLKTKREHATRRFRSA